MIKTGVKQTDFTQGLLRISLKNPVYSEDDIKSIQEEIDMRGNQYLSADYHLFLGLFYDGGGVVGPADSDL